MFDADRGLWSDDFRGELIAHRDRAVGTPISEAAARSRHSTGQTRPLSARETISSHVTTR